MRYAGKGLAAGLLVLFYSEQAQAQTAYKFKCDNATNVLSIFAEEDGRPVQGPKDPLGTSTSTYYVITAGGFLRALEVDEDSTHDRSTVYLGRGLPNNENVTILVQHNRFEASLLELRVWDITMNGAENLQNSKCARLKP
jgi:hypothetical protein